MRAAGAAAQIAGRRPVVEVDRLEVGRAVRGRRSDRLFDLVRPSRQHVVLVGERPVSGAEQLTAAVRQGSAQHLKANGLSAPRNSSIRRASAPEPASREPHSDGLVDAAQLALALRADMRVNPGQQAKAVRNRGHLDRPSLHFRVTLSTFRMPSAAAGHAGAGLTRACSCPGGANPVSQPHGILSAAGRRAEGGRAMAEGRPAADLPPVRLCRHRQDDAGALFRRACRRPGAVRRLHRQGRAGAALEGRASTRAPSIR